jgi:SAM-dependent methyltransferase
MAIERMPTAGIAIDLGCGPGRPVTAKLSARGLAIGVDISFEQLRLARREAPNARLIRADITSVAFQSRSVDVVAAFHVLNHVPPRFVSMLLRSIAGWLRDGGTLVASFPAGELSESIEPDWLGEPMFFAGIDVGESIQLLDGAGFDLLRSEIVTASGPDGELERFLWIVADRRSAAASP